MRYDVTVEDRGSPRDRRGYQIEGDWKRLKGHVKEKWGQLTDDELDKINGLREELVGKIQERYGIARDKAKKEVDSWFDTSGDSTR